MKRQLVITGGAIASALLGCTLAFSPGDYGGGAVANGPPLDGGGTSDATVTGDAMVTPTIEAGPPPSSLHLLVIAGEREGAEPATSDVWSAAIDDAGEVGAFTYLPSGPVRGARFAATIADGRLLVATKTNVDRVVESADFDGGTQLFWRTSLVANPTTLSFGQYFAGSTFFAAGGYSTHDEDDGNGGTVTVTDYGQGFFASTPSAGLYPKALTTTTAKLPVGLHNVSVVTSKNLVFFWGDGADPNQRGKLYSGTIDPVTGATAITDRGTITDPQAGKAHTPTTPIACAGEGHLFIAGGNSDVVLTATIDETTGAVGSWKAGPKLPSILRGSGCAVWKGAVHILGGATGGSAGTIVVQSSRIISSTVAADGTMGAWVTSPRTLLAPRSNLFALTY